MTVLVPRRCIPRLPNLAAFRRLGDPFGGRLGARMLPGVGGRSGGAASNVYVLDNFVDVALTAMNGHTPDIDVVGGGWLTNPGTWRIDADGVGMEHASNTCEDVVSIDAGQADVDITLITDPTPDEGDYGILFRYSALNAMFFYDFAPTMRIIKFDPGASVIGTNTGGPAAGANTWRTRLVGNDISCWIEGRANTLITVTDAAHNTNTRHGARHCLISANARYGQITIEPVGDGSDP